MAEFTEFEKVGNHFSSVDVDVEKVGNHLMKDSEIIGEIVGNHISIDLSAIGGGGGGRVNIVDVVIETVGVPQIVKLGFKPTYCIAYDIEPSGEGFTSCCYTNINGFDDVCLWNNVGYCRKDNVGASYFVSINDDGVTIQTLVGQNPNTTIRIIAIA